LIRPVRLPTLGCNVNPPPPRPRLALRVTLGAQGLVTFVPAIAPVIAPSVAPEFGLAPELVGQFTALTYVVAMLSGMVISNWVLWLGALRVMLFMLAAGAAGAALATVGHVAGLVLAAVAIGLSMGCAHPSFTALIGRHAPPGATAMFMSLRLAAAPAGVALAGLLIPLSLAWLGWRGSLWLAAAMCIVGCLFVARATPALDWPARVPPAQARVASALVRVLREPPLRRLAVVSMAFAMVQQTFVVYSVLSLVRLGVPLPAAAGLLAASQLSSIVTRVLIGRLADRWVPPRPLLAVHGGAMALGCFALAALPAAPSLVLAGSVMIACAAATTGWFGVQFAQLLRIVPREDLAHCAGGTQVLVFGGAILGPYLFALVLAQGASFTTAYLLLGALAAMAGSALLVHAPSAAAERQFTAGADAASLRGPQ